MRTGMVGKPRKNSKGSVPMPTIPAKTIIPSPNDGGAEGSTTKRIGISWGKTAPLVYTWTRGAGLVLKHQLAVIR